MKYISRIILSNIRGFKKLDIDLTDDNSNKHRMRTIIIGENSTCKTTLLRCIAIGLCEQFDGNALISEDIVGKLISQDEETATITIFLQNEIANDPPSEIITSLGIRGENEFVIDKKGGKHLRGLFVTGYGAGRSDEGPDTGRPYRVVDSVYTLFRYDETLLSTELALRRLWDYLGEPIYISTLAGIKKALHLSPEDQIEFKKGGGVVVSGKKIGKSISFESWADGYRLTLNWILDLYSWAMKAQKTIGRHEKVISKSGKIKGILLIDELEQHLHPNLQAGFIDRLSQLMPDLQIFATTHSPLVALGAEPEELVVLKRNGKYIDKVKPPNYRGYSAEDVLTDQRLFDTEPYSPEINTKIQEYKKLSAIPKNKRSSQENTQLRKIAKELLSQQIITDADEQFSRLLDSIREEYKL